jgi:membrane dipeptidase
MNALEWNRDLRWSINEIRESEKGMTDKPDRCNGTVSFHEMRKGNIGICVATLIGRYVDRTSKIPGWHSQEQAWAQTQGQLAWYREMEIASEMVQICDREQLQHHIKTWISDPDKTPIGYILSLEGADSIVSMRHLEKAFLSGLRAIGPAHYGPGVYANGTNSSGKLNVKGIELLKEMDRLGMILDVSHLNDEAFWDALNRFKGQVWASHNNCRKFVDHNRQFSDEMIIELINRQAVIGVALDNWMLIKGWEQGKTSALRKKVSMELVADNIEHICNLAGNAKYVAIGSDLDGAFGTEQSPAELDTIADLQLIPGLLRKRGFSETDIKQVMHQNWIDFLERAWA